MTTRVSPARGAKLSTAITQDVPAQKPTKARRIQRYDPTTKGTPTPWASLVAELWATIFELATPQEFAGAQRASKWFNNLFWDFRRVYAFSEGTHPNAIMNILSRAAPRHVKVLDVENAEVGTRFVKFVSELGFSRLCVLKLSGPFSDDAAMSFITTCFPLLQVLSLRDSLMTDAGLALTPFLAELRELDLEGTTRATDDTFKLAASFPRLEKLRVSCSPRALLALDKGLGIEVNCSRLPFLRQHVGDCSVGILAPLKRLVHLDFGPYMALTDASVETLAALPLLSTLAIGQCQLLSEGAISMITGFSRLQTLKLAKAQFVTNLGKLAMLAQLKRLSLRMSAVTDADVIEFGKLNALEELDLSMCPRFTMTGMEGYRNVVGLSQNTKAIRFVMIEGCRGLAGSLLEKQYDTHPIRDDRGRIVQWCPV